MTYVSHMRVSMIGFLGNSPGADIWQANLSLANGNGSLDGGVLNLGPNETVFDDVRDDIVAWFTSADARIRSHVRLSRVKFAFIGTNGRYTRSPVERDAGNVQGGEGFGTIMPFQIAYAVTLGTDADLGRVKGRFYVPGPSVDIDPNSGQISVAQQTQLRNAADSLVTNINNQPGIDVLGLNVAVASQGRRNRDGSQRLAPANHPVVRVNVGRVMDTIRSRRSALSEAPVYAGVE
jgi:hypothetical protein